MLYEEEVIGFDVREMWVPFMDHWTPNHRQHLIRQDIEKPLAFDRAIWPSIFVPNFMIVGGTGFEKIPGVDVNLEIPDKYKTYEGYWQDLSLMRDYLIQHADYLRKPRWVIAMTELVNKELYRHPQYVEPPDVQTHWKFLGYDVCYGTRWSAIHIYYGDYLPRLREQYENHLNQYHLFINLELAQAFAQWADTDPGHAPHSIYGLYHIESLDGAGLPYAL